MKLGVDIVGDIARIMEAETLAGEKAVTAAMREASTGLKTAWRAQITGAGLGARLASERSEAEAAMQDERAAACGTGARR